jgi:hypothetical protein
MLNESNLLLVRIMVCIETCLFGWRTIGTRIFGARMAEKDRGLSTCKPRSKQVGGCIHLSMNRLRNLNSYQIIFKIKN